MKKLSIVAVICIIAMLFASCSPSIPAPTDPKEGDTETILSMISAISNLDYTDAGSITINDEKIEDLSNFDYMSLIGEDGSIDLTATVALKKSITEDENAVFAGNDTLLPATVTSGNLDLSVSVNFAGSIIMPTPEAPVEDGDNDGIVEVSEGIYLKIEKARISIKSSGTNLIANVGDGETAKEHKLTLSVNTGRDVEELLETLLPTIIGMMGGDGSGMDIPENTIAKLAAALSSGIFDDYKDFDLRLDGTRINVNPIVTSAIDIFFPPTNA